MLEHGDQHGGDGEDVLAVFLLEDLQRFERVESQQGMQCHLPDDRAGRDARPRDMEKG